jgi:hypothetical protein
MALRLEAGEIRIPLEDGPDDLPLARLPDRNAFLAREQRAGSRRRSVELHGHPHEKLIKRPCVHLQEQVVKLFLEGDARLLRVAARDALAERLQRRAQALIPAPRRRCDDLAIEQRGDIERIGVAAAMHAHIGRDRALERRLIRARAVIAPAGATPHGQQAFMLEDARGLLRGDDADTEKAGHLAQ